MDYNTTEKLVLQGASLSIADFAGFYPLHDAGDSDVAKLFLNAGADPSLPSLKFDLNTPLHEAAVYDNIINIEVMLQRGADPTATNKAGKTPFDLTKCDDCKRMLSIATELCTTDSDGESAWNAGWQGGGGGGDDGEPIAPRGRRRRNSAHGVRSSNSSSSSASTHPTNPSPIVPTAATASRSKQPHGRPKGSGRPGRPRSSTGRPRGRQAAAPPIAAENATAAAAASTSGSSRSSKRKHPSGRGKYHGRPRGRPKKEDAS